LKVFEPEKTVTVRSAMPGRVAGTMCLLPGYIRSRWISSETTFLPQILDFSDSTRLLPHFSHAASAWERREPGYLLQVKGTLYALLLLCHQAFTVPQTERKIPYAIRRGIAYLHEHYTDPDFRITHAQAQCGFSSKYFRSLFMEQFLMSPKEYVTALRLQRAKELLAENRHSVAEIATLCGYSDLYHFSKIFKEKLFYAPTVYRRVHGKELP
jgi:AraC-like DNA-binding protein